MCVSDQAHLEGIGALLGVVEDLATPATKFILHNIMWMNEAKLVQNMRGPEREYVSGVQ